MWPKSLTLSLHNFSPEPSFYPPKYPTQPASYLFAHDIPTASGTFQALLSVILVILFHLGLLLQIHVLPASPSPTVHKNKEVNENPNLNPNPKYRRLFTAAYRMMLTKFLLHLKNQFLNLTALIKFSYVVTECKNPAIISQLLLKRQQYKYVLEKHSYKTEPLLCSFLKI